MTLIAKLRIVTGSGQGRKEFAPGDEVTGLAAHDVDQLRRMDALADTDEQDKTAKAQARAQTEAAREFTKARKDVQAAQASLQPDTAAPIKA